MSDDRPKRSWREIDQMRDGTRRREEQKPRGRHAEAQAKQATEQYLKEADKMFASDQGGAEGQRLAAALRASHGTAELPAACREYRDTVGMPDEPSLLALFIDSGEEELVASALEALLERAKAGELEASSGLKSQVRVLAQDFNDVVAAPAEELLEHL